MASTLTRRQADEVADYLHVPFSGGATAGLEASGGKSAVIFVLRPERGRALRHKLIFGLCPALCIAVAVADVVGGRWVAALYLTGLFLVSTTAGVVWFRNSALVVTDDAVYKGARIRGKYAARTEIVEVAYGSRVTMKAANGSTLLSIDASMFTDSQAQQLAAALDLPLRRITKAKTKTKANKSPTK